MESERLVSLSCILCLVMILGACTESSDTKTLKLAHGLDPTHPVHQAFVHMANTVKEKSHGKLTIEIYPGAQLGAERECLELLQIGSIDITKVSAAVMEGFVPEYEVLSLPYLFRSREHAYHVLDGPVGKKLLKLPEKFWLHGLCFYDAGARSFYTKDQPIKDPEDLKGLKIRVQKSVQAVQLVKSFGASPTPISWGELYTALQSGVVDGAENNPPSFYTSHHYEVCKYYSLNEHTRIPDVMMISLHTWNKLTDQEKAWLKEAVKSSVDFQRKVWQQSEQQALEKVKKAGVTILYPDRKAFAKKVQWIQDDLEEKPRMEGLIEQIKETR